MLFADFISENRPNQDTMKQGQNMYIYYLFNDWDVYWHSA